LLNIINKLTFKIIQNDKQREVKRYFETRIKELEEQLKEK